MNFFFIWKSIRYTIDLPNLWRNYFLTAHKIITHNFVTTFGKTSPLKESIALVSKTLSRVQFQIKCFKSNLPRKIKALRCFVEHPLDQINSSRELELLYRLIEGIHIGFKLNLNFGALFREQGGFRLWTNPLRWSEEDYNILYVNNIRKSMMCFRRVSILPFSSSNFPFFFIFILEAVLYCNITFIGYGTDNLIVQNSCGKYRVYWLSSAVHGCCLIRLILFL